MQAEADKALAVVVLSYGPRRSLGDAVRSLLQQDTPSEIVVIHSGGGDVRSALAFAGDAIRVIDTPQRLLPGGARNLGVASTRAPHIAFLADDCLAGEGWVRQRLAAHRAGARAVSSALACHKPADPVALAAHLSLYVRRMPRTDAHVALRYGVSYDRDLFARYGAFREDLESGEDTAFNQQLAPEDAPVWAPDVVTVHQGADTLGAFFRSQLHRGRRMADAWRALGAYDPPAVAKNALSRTALIVRETWRVVEPRHRGAALLSLPLIVCGNIAYAWGALRAGARA